MDVTVDDEFDYSDELFVANVNSFMASITSLIALDELDSEVSSRFGIPNIKRERVPVEIIFSRLGECLYKRCYMILFQTHGFGTTNWSVWNVTKIRSPWMLADPLRGCSRVTWTLRIKW